MSKDLAVLDTTINELISLSEVPKESMVKEMDRNYLALLVNENPTLDKKYFVDFITKCQLTGADPRMNQIYLIVHNSWNAQKQTTEPKGTTVFSYQFFLRLAHRTGELESMRIDTVKEPYLDFSTGKEKPSITTKCHVKRSNQGEITYQARFWEFAKTDKNGNLQGNWKSAPYLMLEKCSVANALRWAFPETLGNMYIADEMEKPTGKVIRPEERDPTPSVNLLPKADVKEAIVEKPQESISDESKAELELLRSEVRSFIETRPDEWFSKLNKDRKLMLDMIAAVKTPENMNKIYLKCMEYDKEADL